MFEHRWRTRVGGTADIIPSCQAGRRGTAPDLGDGFGSDARRHPEARAPRSVWKLLPGLIGPAQLLARTIRLSCSFLALVSITLALSARVRQGTLRRHHPRTLARYPISAVRDLAKDQMYTVSRRLGKNT